MLREKHFANRRRLLTLLDRTLLALSITTTAIIFAWLLYYSSYGLNPGDEGFWLNAMANPFAYPIKIPPNFFDFVFHWPYRWAGGDIAVLRIANVTLTLALGWILSFLTVRRLWTVGWPQAVALSGGIASLSLVAFYWWALTPNYYTLNYQAAMMVMIGLLLADRPGRVCEVLGWILVGVGGWCSFMARPATAAALAVIVMFYVVALQRKSLLLMLSAALIALTLVIAICYSIGGGITGLATSMVKGTEGITLLDGGHKVSHILRIDWLETSHSQIAFAAFLATALLLSIFMASKHKLLTSGVLAAVLIVTITIVLLGTNPIRIKLSMLFLVPAFTCVGAMFYRRGIILRGQGLASIVLALTFLVLPHLLALSSRVNYWVVGYDACLFWMLAAVVFLSPLAQEGRSVAALMPLTVLAQLLIASLVNGFMLKPWRQVKDLRAYSAVTTLPGRGRLMLSQAFHDYLVGARTQARAAGLEVGTPVIDLANAPTLLYVLETRPLGLPWLFGGYPGSNALAVKALGVENCADMAKAWVLIAPEGPRHLDYAGVLASFGAGKADYVATASFEVPVIEGYYPNAHRQFLMKPIRSAVTAEQSCLEVRR
ncbi:hypothetical protein [Bradyrhizobium sp. CCGE-LA001]|uniref:hypothetical protein n=1 Tax=Bradyrhizobium sp. CCGE-LA001 TaxID=1223566 RepID=UPI000745D86A|nr:hypothetical protein [Bradyrhizobium sp. CCGE-LA001]AMA60021.1 hypothetical protein BCCGELA001_29790 [Bradyrhizobium sp. CCGE-LA001]